MPKPAFATVLFVRDVMTRPASAAQRPAEREGDELDRAGPAGPESRPAVSFSPIT